MLCPTVGIHSRRTGEPKRWEHPPSSVPQVSGKLSDHVLPRRQWIPHLLCGETLSGVCSDECRKSLLVWEEWGRLTFAISLPLMLQQWFLTLSFYRRGTMEIIQKPLALIRPIRWSLWCLCWGWCVLLCLKPLQNWKIITHVLPSSGSSDEYLPFSWETFTPSSLPCLMRLMQRYDVIHVKVYFLSVGTGQVWFKLYLYHFLNDKTTRSHPTLLHRDVLSRPMASCHCFLLMF